MKEIKYHGDVEKYRNIDLSNFFNAISYDFKTVASLILSSTDFLLESADKNNAKELHLIRDNSKLLLKMINHLIDLRKLYNDELELKISKTNIVDFVKEIFSELKSTAAKKKIDFIFTDNEIDSCVFIDRDLIYKGIYNLLINAIKLTTFEGVIQISIKEDLNFVFISVEDSGIAISEVDLNQIFLPLYQQSSYNKTTSGVGLYLTEQYVKLHKGEVKVQAGEQKGIIFSIKLPKGETHFNKNQLIITEDLRADDIFKENEESKSQIEDKLEVNTRDIVLLIEDNDDLRFFLKSKLKKNYNVFESDGISVENMVLEIVPDIIISDLNLPDKNGFEICEFIKNDERTSHIPIIMLTSLNTDEAHLKGLKSGVDMFLTKPFNLSVLSQSVETLLNNRRQLQKYFSQLNSNESNQNVVKEKDKASDKQVVFVNKINKLINANLDDSSFSVEILADELHISRVQLYRKTKALLGITISDYIQNIRLEKSKVFLSENRDLSIADIAYSVGFSSPNYFSTAFKNKFGKTPNEFKRS
ncbi:hypothetical protein BTO06_02045 [Tenacibaculum sp. SZ-18]|uniref:hybrid sensor histidine kinase/response regulator transcription factor n=1 Tax=Tenacibaculum sp. SZ-18 TaxID=754423 RepID=UPI000C2D056C|nr:helix-turn-helix domain-containing protein [Tenacibaculum sp. SZ-18]AUC14010.1 hypothetical protein BTO06_02045 [Tenacibaculum sp. SZ-18]